MIRRILKSWFFWIPLAVGATGRVTAGVWQRCRRLADRFSSLWGRLNHFQGNIVIGVLIAIGLHLGHSTSWVRDTEDWAMDWMNRIQVDTSRLAGHRDDAAKYTFIDINEKAFTRWGEPYHVPRDKLLQLIRYASEGGASTIIVDVDFSRAGIDASADLALRNYLSTYPDDAAPLILMRTFLPQRKGSKALPLMRRSYFDADISSAAINWAQPRFQLDSEDRSIRRWNLVEAGCLDGQPAWLPSPQMLVALFSKQGKSGWLEIENQLDQMSPSTCKERVAGLNNGSVSVEVAGHQLNLFADGAAQRVLYSFSDRLPFGSEELGYMRLPAAMITESSTALANDPVKDRVVIIGTSYQASHDIHSTPVGEMPGALIILNAARSLSNFGQLQGPPGWIKLLLEGLLIVLMAYAFSRFDSIGGLVLTGIGVILVLVPLSFYLFRYGIWVDLAAPILGMQIHQVWAEYEEHLAAKKAAREAEQEKHE